MANSIDWTFRLLDQVSGPARRAAGGIGEFIQTTHSALAVIDMLGRAGVRAGEMLASALEPARFKESTLAGLGVLLKDAQKAEDMYRQAVRFAAATPFETKQVIDSYQKLLVAGFSETEIPVVLKGVGDLASIKGFSAEVIDRVTMAFGQIKAKGKMQGEELMQLAEAGVPLGRVYEELAKTYGTNTDAIRKMQEAGEISADAGIFAVMKVLKEDIGGGKLGAVMDKTSKTLDGIVSTLKSRPFEYLQELFDTEGYDDARNSLLAISNVLDPMTDKGQRLLDTVRGFGGGLLERIFGNVDDDAAGQMMDQLILRLEQVQAATFGLIDGLKAGLGPLIEAGTDGGGLDEVSATFRTLGTNLGVIVQVGAKVANAILAILGAAHKFGQWASDHPQLTAFFTGNPLFNFGAAAATGSVRQGFMQSNLGQLMDPSGGGGRTYTREEFDRAYNARNEDGSRTEAYHMVQRLRERHADVGMDVGDGLAMGLDEGIRMSLDTRSPSKVTEGIGREVGGHAGEGLALGLTRGLSASGGGGLVFAPVINVPISGSSSSAGDIAAAVRDVLMSEFEAWALQAGRV